MNARLALILASFVFASGLHAATPPAELLKPSPSGPAVTTHHKARIDGASFRYTATVEALDVTDPNGRTRIVSFAYTRDKAGDPAGRPVMFLFNGGPIVASEYVHLGGLGPYRLAVPDDISADPSTFKVVPNEYSPLDAVDLVFVDPASTGWSRVADGTQPEAYYSVKADAQQFVAFIKAWLEAHGRTASPVFLFGESYGTNRAGQITELVAESPAAFNLKGVFFYGEALNIIEYSQRPANVTSYVVSLPTLAAIGWFHGKVERGEKSQATFIEDCRQFANTDYLTALFQGNRLAQTERERVAARLEQCSGIPASWYLAHDLRITKEQYREELLRSRGLLLGRADARYAAPLGPKGRAVDPSGLLGKAVQDHFAAYRRDVLGVDWSDAYLEDTPVDDLDRWDWGHGASPFADWPYYLGVTRMMSLDPKFRVVIGSGQYDTMTTMGAARLLDAQSGWDPARTTVKDYDGGHMGYSVAATAREMGKDIRQLVQQR